MNRPDKDLEKDLNSVGVFVEDKRDDIPKDATYLSVHVEVGFENAEELSVPDFDIMIINKRGVKSYFTSFRLIERGNQKVVLFEAYQKAPDDYPLHGNFSKLYVSSYVDLCWNLGNSAVQSDLLPSVVTEIKEGATYVDMGWVLPSRYVDSMTNALGVLNNTIMSGTLVDALLYGPFISYKE